MHGESGRLGCARNRRQLANQQAKKPVDQSAQFACVRLSISDGTLGRRLHSATHAKWPPMQDAHLNFVSPARPKTELTELKNNN